MFFCEPCRVKKDWPKGLREYPHHHGPCECCEEVRDCYDVPSSHLPLPKRKVARAPRLRRGERRTKDGRIVKSTA